MKLPTNPYIVRPLSIREIAARMQDDEYPSETLIQHLAAHWNRIEEWGELSDAGLRLRCGELTAQEIRTIRAVLNAILDNPDKTVTRPTSNTRCEHQYEASSPIDTVETCVKCGANQSCEPLVNQWTR